jgi:hypothetical protein
MTRDVDFPGEARKPESKQYVVRIRTHSGEYEGIMFSPHPERRLSEALGRMDEFVNLKDARDLASKEKFPFMVISKEHIETIKVLDER